MDDVGNPTGRVVVVEVVVVDVDVVGAAAIVVATVRAAVVVSASPEASEQAVLNKVRLPRMISKALRSLKIRATYAKLSRFTLCSLEE